uniref:Uncharacterized protein n=1 Tax=Poecilia latipinna TaxID=48699 RepID=A0A3B3TQD7_9TELE
MPSDFISLFNGDRDLNSPGSLYSKVCRSMTHPSLAFTVGESVYDLLASELKLPPSTQQSPEVMSQKSDGEAGPLPSAPLASGRILLLLSLFLLSKQD